MVKLFASLLLAVCSALIFAAAGRSDPPSPKDNKGAEKTASRTDLYGDPLPPGAIARLGTMRLRQEGGSGWFGTAFLDGGKILAMGGASLRFWDTTTGRLLGKVKGEFEFPLVPSADGKWLAMRDIDSISIWEFPSCRLVRRLEPVGGKPSFGNPKVFSKDGRVLVEGESGTLRLWDTTTGKEIRHLDAEDFAVGEAVFTNQGRGLVTTGLVTMGGGKRQAVICHWDLTNGKLLQKIPIDFWPNRSLRLSHDGQLVAVSPSEGAVRLLDAQTGKELCRLQGEKVEARRLAFSYDDRLLAATWFKEGDDSATISMWNSATGKLIHRFSIPIQLANYIQFAPDGRTFLTKNAWLDKLWDVNTGKSLLEWPAHESYITNLSYLPDGRKLISGSFDRTTRIWDIVTGRQLRELPFSGLDDRLLPGAQAILSNTIPGAITVRDLEAGKVVRRFSFEEQPEKSASLFGLSSDGRTLAAYSPGAGFLNIPPTYNFHVWDFTAGRLISQRQDRFGIFLSLISPDGKLVAGRYHTDKDQPSLQAQSVAILDAMTGRQLLTVPQPDQSSQTFAFSPDVQTFLTESDEELLEGNEQRIGKTTLHFWELRSGRERLTIPSEKSGWEFQYNATAFSPDGRKLVTVRGDATIQLWDIAKGKELLRRSGYDARVNCLAIAPDGMTFASGHNDSTILVWDIPEASRVSAAKGAADPKDLEVWWSDLASSDARKGHTAIWELVDHPQQAVPLLRDRLKAALAFPPEQLRQMLRDLDSSDFETREAGSKKLAEFTDDLQSSLQEILKASKSAEQRRRIEALLAAPHIVPAGDKLRYLRAVEVLEHISTPEAQQVLQSLAKGAPDARLTQEAKASLERLNPKPVSLP